MMKLELLVIDGYDAGEHIALIRSGGRIVTTGDGPSPRGAVLNAINTHFAGLAEPVMELSEDVFVQPTADPTFPPAFQSRSDTEQEGIRRLLEETASTPDGRVRLTYTDSVGTQSERIVEPMAVETHRRGVGFQTAYLKAYDIEKDEPRTFRLDRIDRVATVQ